MSAKEEAIAAATASLKKIQSAKGSLQGSFYAYATKDDAALAVTLVARDPKGAKALGYGRALKKEHPRGKFLRGSVIFDKSAGRLVFIPGPGNLSGNILKTHLKTGFDDTNLKRFTKRAKIDMSKANELKAPNEQETVVDDVENDNNDNEAPELFAEDDSALLELIARQEELGKLHQSLGFFLKNQSDENVTRDLIKAGVKTITDLTSTHSGDNTEAIEAELTQLVGFACVGDDPFGGDTIPPEVGLLIKHAGSIMNARSTEAESTHTQQLAPIFQEAEEILAELGGRLLNKAVKDHNVKVPDDESATHSTLVSQVLPARYAGARKELYNKFIPPDSGTLGSGQWKKGFLQLVRAQGLKELEKVTLLPELKKLLDNANRTRPIGGQVSEPLKFHKEVCDSSWNAVKKALSQDPVSMWQMVLYRKRVVDGLLNAQRTLYPALLAKCVGSENLTSDYDLTLSTRDASGKEIEAIQNFNKSVKDTYTKQPGVVFDTNLYAKDFLKVKDTVFNTETEDGGDIAPVLRYLEMDRSGQDIAALTKMRQYMTQQEWEDYCSGLQGDEKTRRQLDEADAKYHLKLNTVLEGILQQYDTGIDEGTVERDHAIDLKVKNLFDLRARADGGDLSALVKSQRLTETMVTWLNEHFENLTLETRNALYLSKMTSLRSVQALHGQLEDWVLSKSNPLDQMVTQMAGLHELDPEAARKEALQLISAELKDTKLIKLLHSDITRFITLAKDDPTGQEAREYLLRKIDALKEEARHRLGDANYYAAEAYLSEGPLQHIVNGNQSDNPEVFEKLRPEHFLGSINEQTGDFFKDVGHYAGNEHPGVAFYQTAKYLHRMFEGIVKLSLKDDFEDVESMIAKPSGWGSAEEMMQRIDTHFMPIRSAKGDYALMNESEKSAAAMTKLSAVYGSSISTIGQLKSEVMKLSQSINSAIREKIAMRPSASSRAQTMGMQTGTA